jgi:hypothetical protein
MSAEMKRLADAQVKLVAAQGILADAKVASEGARKFSVQIEREVVERVRKNEDLAASRTAALKRAMKLGAKPPSSRQTPGIVADYVARRAAEDRLTVSKHVLKELLAEEDEAQLAVEAAIAQLHAAARTVLAEEASALVSKIEKLEAESLRTRVAVESFARSGLLGLGRELGGCDANTKEILRGNTLLPIGITNHALWREANVAAEQVRQRYADLMKSPNPALKSVA